MSEPTRTALILGATGLVGSLCLDLLLVDERYSRVIALTRRPIGQSHSKLLNLVTDFADLTPIADKFNSEDVFCALGTTIRHAGSKDQFRRVDFDFPLRVAELAVKNGARRLILVSAIGASSSSSVYYLQVKGDLENALAKLPFQSQHFLRPAMLDGERRERRSRERAGVIVSRAISFVLVGPWRKYRVIMAADVARAMLIVAKQTEPGVHIYESDQIQSTVDIVAPAQAYNK